MAKDLVAIEKSALTAAQYEQLAEVPTEPEWLTNITADGLATAVLADFGSEAIKIEPPDGDPFAAIIAVGARLIRGPHAVSVMKELSYTNSQIADLRSGQVSLGTKSTAFPRRAFKLDSLSACINQSNSRPQEKQHVQDR